MMGETIEQGRGYLRVAEYLHPFADAEIGGDALPLERVVDKI